jgi:hypothetical protein
MAKTDWGQMRNPTPDEIGELLGIGIPIQTGTDQTRTINKAIEKAQEKGGGTVSIVGQVGITSRIDVPDKVHLRIELGARLYSAADITLVKVLDGGLLTGPGTIESTISSSRTDSTANVLLYADGDERINQTNTGVHNLLIKGNDKTGGAGLELFADDADGAASNGAIAYLNCSNLTFNGMKTGMRLRCTENSGASNQSFVNGNNFNNLVFGQVINCIESIESGTGQPAITGNNFNNIVVQYASGMVRIIKGSVNFTRNKVTNIEVFDWDSASSTEEMFELANTATGEGLGNYIHGYASGDTDAIADVITEVADVHNIVLINGVSYSAGAISMRQPTTTLVASTDTITVTRRVHPIASNSGALDVNTINGGIRGALVTLTGTSGANVVTLKDAADNLRLAGDFAIGPSDTITLVKGSTGLWQEVSRSNN